MPLTTRWELPTTTRLSGTSLLMRVFAPMTTLLPMVTPAAIDALSPISITRGRFTSTVQRLGGVDKGVVVACHSQRVQFFDIIPAHILGVINQLFDSQFQVHHYVLFLKASVIQD